MPRTFAPVVLAAAVVATAAVGCELVLGDLPPVGGGGGGGSSSSSSASTSAATTTTTSSSSGAGGSCCDCDGDHAEAEGACGGKDCDDHDANVFPGEPTYYPMKASNPAVGWDWDCSGTIDRDPTLDKTVNCGLLGLPCTATDGFLATTVPECGKPGTWGSCKQQGVSCVNDVKDSARVMLCK